jgi:hypothetical protein
MPHPLADLDGKRKFLLSYAGQKFYLKAVTSKEEMAANPDAMEKLAFVVYEAQIDLNKELQGKGRRIQNLPPAPTREGIKASQAHFPEAFNGGAQFDNPVNRNANRTVFIVENEEGKIASLVHLTINDAVMRQRLSVPADVGTFVFVDDAITVEEYKGKGLLSSALNHVVTLLEAKTASPFEYCISMRAAMEAEAEELLAPVKTISPADVVEKIPSMRKGEKLTIGDEEIEADTRGDAVFGEAVKSAAKDDSAPTATIVNLPMYIHMWRKRFSDISLRDRMIFRPGNGLSTKEMPLEGYLDVDGVLDSKRVSQLVAVAKEDAERLKDGFRAAGLMGPFGVGAYLSGRKAASEAAVDDSASWSRAPRVSVVSASAVAVSSHRDLSREK